MHAIQPARLKPGVHVNDLGRGDDPRVGVRLDREIRGRALIVWDPANPGKKLDAIDTDAITPARDCVSESLDALDERWKAGSFRFLIPD